MLESNIGRIVDSKGRGWFVRWGGIQNHLLADSALCARVRSENALRARMHSQRTGPRAGVLSKEWLKARQGRPGAIQERARAAQERARAAQERPRVSEISVFHLFLTGFVKIKFSNELLH